MRPSKFNPILWRYSPTVPTDRLVRHHRICDRLMRWWLWSLVTMLAALCQWLLFRNRLEMVVMLLAVAVALLVSIPALVSMLWREDIERILADRGVDLPAVQALERHSVRSFNKMLLWLVAFVLILAWLSRGN